MKKHRLLSIVVSLLLTFTVGVTVAVAAVPSSDKDQVTETVKTMFVAATNDDLAKFHTVVTPDFYAYDGGKRFTGDALMALIKTLHASGKVFVWRVTEPEVHVYGDTAFITYINQGSVQDANGTQSVTWLESAVLRKDQGNWQIRFLQSTRVPPQSTQSK